MGEQRDTAENGTSAKEAEDKKEKMEKCNG